MRLHPSNVATALGTEWLTAAKVKAHLRLNFSEDDEQIDDLIAASERWVRGYLNRPVLDETLTVTWGPVKAQPTELLAPFVEANVQVTSLNVSVAGAAASAQSYKGQPFYDRDLRQLTFDLEDVPDIDDDNRGVFTAVLTQAAEGIYRPAVRRARLLWIGEMYEQRAGAAELQAVRYLLDSHRVVP